MYKQKKANIMKKTLNIALIGSLSIMLFIMACAKKSNTTIPIVTTPTKTTSKLDLNKLCNKLWVGVEYYNSNDGKIYNYTPEITKTYHSVSMLVNTYFNGSTSSAYFKIINDTTISEVISTLDSTNLAYWQKSHLTLTTDTTLLTWQMFNGKRIWTSWKIRK